MNWSVFFSNIILHVGIMALFLTIFFFTIAQYFEKKIIEDQIEFVINDFVGNSLKPVSDSTKQEIKDKINAAFKKQDFSKSDLSVKKQNSQIAKKAWTFVGILIGIVILIVIGTAYYFKWDFYFIKYIFNSALISLIMVALTETLFMYLVAQNFLSADPNQIKLKIIETLKDNRCGPNSNYSNINSKECIGPNK